MSDGVVDDALLKFSRREKQAQDERVEVVMRTLIPKALDGVRETGLAHVHVERRDASALAARLDRVGIDAWGRCIGLAEVLGLTGGKTCVVIKVKEY